MGTLAMTPAFLYIPEAWYATFMDSATHHPASLLNGANLPMSTSGRKRTSAPGRSLSRCATGQRLQVKLRTSGLLQR